MKLIKFFIIVLLLIFSNSMINHMNIYSPVDYKKKPQKYCGMTITDNPYYDF